MLMFRVLPLELDKLALNSCYCHQITSVMGKLHLHMKSNYSLFFISISNTFITVRSLIFIVHFFFIVFSLTVRLLLFTTILTFANLLFFCSLIGTVLKPYKCHFGNLLFKIFYFFYYLMVELHYIESLKLLSIYIISIYCTVDSFSLFFQVLIFLLFCTSQRFFVFVIFLFFGCDEW